MATNELVKGETYVETLPWNQDKYYDVMEYVGMTVGKGGVGLYLFDGTKGRRCFTEGEVRRGYVRA